MEERLDTLETAVAFQEEKIAELSEYLNAQQLQMQALERVVEKLSLQIQSLMQPETPPGNVKPPHY